MPELPDIAVYVDAFERLFVGQTIQSVSVRCPFIVRTFDPALISIVDRRLEGVRSIGKRVVWQIEGDLFVVFHLMIAGRFHQRKHGTKPRSKHDLVAFQFETNTLMLTEASKKRRASIHVVRGEESLAAHDPRGLEVLDCSASDFRGRLVAENRTLKRALTDPRKFSGIGNAFSDEILHAAGLSPVRRSRQLSDDDVERLFSACVTTLTRWRELLLDQNRDGFPEKVTAFRPEMAVHGKFEQPCPKCGTKVQRIMYAENETNYCPRCQTSGKLLADRAMSRLLKDDWPKTIEELEEIEMRIGDES